MGGMEVEGKAGVSGEMEQIAASLMEEDRGTETMQLRLQALADTVGGIRNRELSEDRDRDVHDRPRPRLVK